MSEDALCSGTIKLTSPGARPTQSPGQRPSFQYRDGAFICDLCKESFSDGNDMVTHWKSHVKKQQADASRGGRGRPRGRGRGRPSFERRPDSSEEEEDSDSEDDSPRVSLSTSSFKNKLLLQDCHLVMCFSVRTDFKDDHSSLFYYGVMLYFKWLPKSGLLFNTIKQFLERGQEEG